MTRIILQQCDTKAPLPISLERILLYSLSCYDVSLVLIVDADLRIVDGSIQSLFMLVINILE